MNKLKQKLEDGLKAIFLSYPKKIIKYRCYIIAPKSVIDEYNNYIKQLKKIDNNYAVKYYFIEENTNEKSKNKTYRK